ncbi:MAG: hypothetical protein R6X11_11375 [Desulfonatronovibrio sp.]
MEKDHAPEKRKTPGWARYLSIIAALLGAIAVFISPTKLNVIVLIVLIANVGLQFKDIFKG